MAAIVGISCPAALWVLIRDGPLAMLVLLAGLGLGAFPFRWLTGGGKVPYGWHLAGSEALGLGLLSLLVLGFGSMGLLSRPLWWTIVLIFTGVATGWLFSFRALPPGRPWPKKSGTAEAPVFGGGYRPRRGARLLWPRAAGPERQPCPPLSAEREVTQRLSVEIEAPADRRMAWLWLTCIPFGAFALLASTMPPGTLWPAEGNGYDVLEYHLGAPRDYLDRGRIEYLPHNIYSNLPFNVEMLYLLTMILRGGPVKAALSCQSLNVLLGLLAVGAVWLAARPFGRPCAGSAALLTASCPFLAYLSGVAYVENGMLFFSALALAAILEADRGRRGSPGRWLAFAGLMSGLACGCKYTAVPQVLSPLLLAAGWIGRRRPRDVARSVLAFGLPALLAFAPWLIKNAIATGNPVFPLARAVFGERPGIWDDDGAARWHEGHLPAPVHRSLSGRAVRLWDQILADPLFGPLPAAMIVASALVALGFVRPAGLAPCWFLAAGVIATWLGFTHLVDRFAVVLIIPAAIVIAVAAEGLPSPRRFAWLVVVLLIAANLFLTLRLFQQAAVFQICRVRQTDGLEWFTGGQWPTHEHVPELNKLSREGARVLMIGDARRFYLDAGVDYCVVFNRNPFADAAVTKSPAELLAWLRDQGYGCLYVDWSEMRRLRASRYGFWRSIDAALLQKLTEAGLEPTRHFTIIERDHPYSTLYRIP